jgi:polysaccharide biosynthesis/export protein
MSHLSRRFLYLILPLGTGLVTACGSIPTSGPSALQIQSASTRQPSANAAGIQIVDVTDEVARRLFVNRAKSNFYVTFGGSTVFQQQLGIGDQLEISIWEAPPATLFGSAISSDTRSISGNSKGTVLPDQTVDADGTISVPFAGQIKAAGRTPGQLQRDIAGRLKGIAHDPQVLVKLSQNVTSYVTVVGDVASSTRMPLSPRGERLLDALASAGGVKQSVDKVTLQVTRGDTVASLPLQTVIREPRQNVPLRAGDVVTALYQPYSFTALGATGKNQEIDFEAQGISLAQALARAGGLQDNRSDAQGVFIFRLEDAAALPWPMKPVRTTIDGKVPVVYRVNLRDPNAFFAAQNFMMENKDLLYVANAPVAELQKFLNVIFSVAYPIVNGVNTFR